MTRKPNWVCHKQKVPRVPFGAFASSTNRETWRDHATAVSGAQQPGIDGIGFVLDGEGIACIDLDDCLHDGVLDDWAQEIVDRCPRTYIEVSPSGRGLHIFGYATVGKGRRSGGVEVYDRGRYICVTGRRFGGFPRRLSDISAVVAAL
jgi:primase-polymerase (primpol)-like protein